MLGAEFVGSKQVRQFTVEGIYKMYLKPICGVCASSTLQIVVCGDYPDYFFVICEECDSAWETPELLGEPYYPEYNEWRCPNGKGTAKVPPSYAASEAQIRALGWWQYVDEKTIK